MPPKKTPAPSKKAEQKKKEKVIEVYLNIFSNLKILHYILNMCIYRDLLLFELFHNIINFLQDKTFGIKNKKGAKQQKFIQQVEKQVKSGGVNPRKLEDPNIKKLEKEKKLKEQKELALIFKPVQSQKIDKGIN